MEEKKKKNYWPIIIIVLVIFCSCSLFAVVILMGISSQGVKIAQGNARNTQRRAIVQDVLIESTDFYLEYSEYPEKIKLSDGELILTNGTNIKKSMIIGGFTKNSVSYNVSDCTRTVGSDEMILCYDRIGKELVTSLEDGKGSFSLEF